MKYCTKCGAQLSDDNNFCTICGSTAPQIQPQVEATNSTNNKEEAFNSVKLNKQEKTKKNNAYICPIFIGIVLILIGCFIQVPGGVLTTYESFNGDKADLYVFDDKYSSIDEYVGGDAYNYIIGSSLVAGKISGTMTMKSIFFVGGALCLCFGITLKMLQKTIIQSSISSNNVENTECTVN